MSPAMKNHGKGQSGLELAVITIIVLSAVLIFAGAAFRDLSADADVAHARIAVRQLAGAADLVAAQGEGSSQEVEVFIPDSTDFSSPYTKISGKEVSLGVSGRNGLLHEIYRPTLANVSGSYGGRTGRVVFAVSLNSSGTVSIFLK